MIAYEIGRLMEKFFLQ